MQRKIKAKKPFILILYGYPGSGKSAFAKSFAGVVENTIHINLDKTESELGKSLQQAATASPGFYESIIQHMAKEFIEAGFNVILDVPLNKKSDRRKIRMFANNVKAKLVMVWLQIDEESAFDRLKKRDKRKTSDKYLRSYTQAEFESIINASHNPNQEDYVVISGKHTFDTQKSAVLKKLQELNILSFEQTPAKKIKPELVNLIPQSFRGKDDLRRRDISIRQKY